MMIGLTLSITGTLAIPMPSPNYLATHSVLQLPDVVGLTGGGATKLDGITQPTAENSLICIEISSELQEWRLVAGTDATNASSGWVRHANYAGGTFEFGWLRKR